MNKKIAETALEKVAAAHGVDVSSVTREIERAIRSAECPEIVGAYPSAVELVAYLADRAREQLWMPKIVV